MVLFLPRTDGVRDYLIRGELQNKENKAPSPPNSLASSRF